MMPDTPGKDEQDKFSHISGDELGALCRFVAFPANSERKC